MSESSCSIPNAFEGRGLTFRYPDGTVALGGIDLRLGEGEIVSVVGPSGCGKSTLLRIIAGLATQSSGELTWQSQDESRPGQPTSLTPRVAVVFQGDTVLPWLTVEKNVAFGLRYLRMSRAEQHSRVTKLLEAADLSDVRGKFPYQLSGGMRRRVALLTSVAVEPRVLLLDEPFSGLDEPTRLILHDETLRIVRRGHISVLLVTHDLGEAVSISDRIYVLSSRPARVHSEHIVGIGLERDVFSVRETAAFAETYQAVWKDLRTVISTRQDDRTRQRMGEQ